MNDAREDVEFGTSEAGVDAKYGGAGVARADGLTRRCSFEDDDGSVFELRAQAQHGLCREFADVETSVEGEGHRLPDFVGLEEGGIDQGVRVLQRMLWSH